MNINTDEWKQIFKFLGKDTTLQFDTLSESGMCRLFIVSKDSSVFCKLTLPVPKDTPQVKFSLSFLSLEKIKKLQTKNPKKSLNLVFGDGFISVLLDNKEISKITFPIGSFVAYNLDKSSYSFLLEGSTTNLVQSLSRVIHAIQPSSIVAPAFNNTNLVVHNSKLYFFGLSNTNVATFVPQNLKFIGEDTHVYLPILLTGYIKSLPNQNIKLSLKEKSRLLVEGSYGSLTIELVFSLPNGEPPKSLENFRNLIDKPMNEFVTVNVKNFIRELEDIFEFTDDSAINASVLTTQGKNVTITASNDAGNISFNLESITGFEGFSVNEPLKIPTGFFLKTLASITQEEVKFSIENNQFRFITPDSMDVIPRISKKG